MKTISKSTDLRGEVTKQAVFLDGSSFPPVVTFRINRSARKKNSSVTFLILFDKNLNPSFFFTFHLKSPFLSDIIEVFEVAGVNPRVFGLDSGQTESDLCFLGRVFVQMDPFCKLLIRQSLGASYYVENDLIQVRETDHVEESPVGFPGNAPINGDILVFFGSVDRQALRDTRLFKGEKVEISHFLQAYF